MTGSTTMPVARPPARYGYDPISRLEGLTHDLDGAGTGNDVGVCFGYNPASQITTRLL